MKERILYISLLPLFLVSGCSMMQNKDSNGMQTVVDPSYNFMVENNNKIVKDSYINFKVNSVINGNIRGVITNNIFNSDGNVILFKVGDKISFNYANLGASCSYNNAVITNYKNEDTTLNGFIFMNGDSIFSCNPKSKTVGLNIESEIYTLNVLTSSAIILNGVTAPNIQKQPKDSLYDLYKVVLPKDNLIWKPKSIVDNGIQTYIKLDNMPDLSSSKLYVFNNLGGHKAIHINYEVVSNGLLIDGVYGALSLVLIPNNSNTSDTRGEISILRNNVPNTTNSLVEQLYNYRDGFYKQDNTNQQGVVSSVYNQTGKSTQTNGVASNFNTQNQAGYNEDLVIAKANSVNNQATPQTSINNSNSSVNNSQSFSSQSGNNFKVPPISTNKDSTTQTFPVNDNSDDSSPVQNNGMGISIMNQLGFGGNSSK